MLIEPLLWSHDILGIVNSFFFSLILWTRLSLSPFNRQGNWGTEKLRNLSRSQSGMSGRARFCSQAPALRICGSKSVTSHWPVIHFPPLSVHRPIYSNFVLMSWKQSADVPQGFHSSSKTWVVVFSFSFFKDFLRAISKFIKTFTVRVCTSFIRTLLLCHSSHISSWFLWPHLSQVAPNMAGRSVPYLHILRRWGFLSCPAPQSGFSSGDSISFPTVFPSLSPEG